MEQLWKDMFTYLYRSDAFYLSHAMNDVLTSIAMCTLRDCLLIPNSSAYREEENFIFPITIHPDVSGYVILLHSGVSIIDVRPTLRTQPPARSVDARKSSHSHRMNA